MAIKDPVDVYSIPLDGSINDYEKLFALLSVDERERAAKFKFDHNRMAWVNSRAALRSVLAQHSNTTAQDIVFRIRADGKPELQESGVAAPQVSGKDEKSSGPTDPVYFNLSHSGMRALIAVSRSSDIGCDIEHIKRIRDWPAVSRRFFSIAEQNELAEVDSRDQLLAFYTCWTRKEAVIKTTGEGLRADLSSFDVSLTPGEEALIYAHRGASSNSPPWQLFHINPGIDYVGAVALQASSPQLLRLHHDWESITPT